jgi:hypothetical protein
MLSGMTIRGYVHVLVPFPGTGKVVRATLRFAEAQRVLRLVGLAG